MDKWYTSRPSNNELLTHEERLEVLNAINDMLDERNIDLEVCGYEDDNGVIFSVNLMKRNLEGGSHD